MRQLAGSLVILLVVTLVSTGCSKEPSSSPAPVEPSETAEPTEKKATGGAVIVKESARTLSFDGFKLGDSYADMIAKAPYDKPCDDDPVDAAKTIRAMVYGGTPCRGNTFAEGTTVLVFIPNKGNNNFNVPIRAIAWLGGSYFDKRSTLGLPIAAKREAVRKRLGEPTSTLALPDRLALTVETHPGQIHAIYDGDVAAGYALGPLPTVLEEGDEHWRAVSQLYRRYTARVSGLSDGDQKAACEELFTRYVELMRADPKHAAGADELAANKDKAIEQCIRKLSPTELACTRKAKTFEAMRECERGRKR